MDCAITPLRKKKWIEPNWPLTSEQDFLLFFAGPVSDSSPYAVLGFNWAVAQQVRDGLSPLLSAPQHHLAAGFDHVRRRRLGPSTPVIEASFPLTVGRGAARR